MQGARYKEQVMFGGVYGQSSTQVRSWVGSSLVT